MAAFDGLLAFSIWVAASSSPLSLAVSTSSETSCQVAFSPGSCLSWIAAGAVSRVMVKSGSIVGPCASSALIAVLNKIVVTSSWLSDASEDGVQYGYEGCATYQTVSSDVLSIVVTVPLAFVHATRPSTGGVNCNWV